MCSFFSFYVLYVYIFFNAYTPLEQAIVYDPNKIDTDNNALMPGSCTGVYLHIIFKGDNWRFLLTSCRLVMSRYKTFNSCKR